MGPVDRGLALAAEGLRRATAHRGSRLAVLTYHRVDEPEARPDLFPGLISARPAAFEQQMIRLARRYRVLSFDELLAIRRGAEPLRGTVVAITFDDGYRDVGEIAWPILRRLGLPATLFVPTGLVGASGAFWWDRLWAALAAIRPGQVVRTPLGEVRIDDPQDRLSLHRSWRSRLKQLPDDRLTLMVDETCASLGAPAIPGALLGWDELRSLASQGLAIQAHSRFHPLLTNVGANTRLQELVGAREDLAERIGSPAAMAYPSGAYDAGVVTDTTTAGYEIAFTTERGVEDLRQVDWLRVRRINVGGASTMPVIELQIGWPATSRRADVTEDLKRSDYTTAVLDTAADAPRSRDAGD